jgi:tellurite resistance-related uncharacterized protein
MKNLPRILQKGCASNAELYGRRCIYEGAVTYYYMDDSSFSRKATSYGNLVARYLCNKFLRPIAC